MDTCSNKYSKYLAFSRLWLRYVFLILFYLLQGPLWTAVIVSSFTQAETFNTHSFGYVSPSDPHTGRYILGQTCGHFGSSCNRITKRKKLFKEENISYISYISYFIIYLTTMWLNLLGWWNRQKSVLGRIKKTF